MLLSGSDFLNYQVWQPDLRHCGACAATQTDWNRVARDVVPVDRIGRARA